MSPRRMAEVADTSEVLVDRSASSWVRGAYRMLRRVQSEFGSRPFCVLTSKNDSYCV